MSWDDRRNECGRCGGLFDMSSVNTWPKIGFDECIAAWRAWSLRTCPRDRGRNRCAACPGDMPPVRELVGVRVEDGVQPKRLHGAPWVKVRSRQGSSPAHEDSRLGRTATFSWRVHSQAQLVEQEAHTSAPSSTCSSRPESIPSLWWRLVARAPGFGTGRRLQPRRHLSGVCGIHARIIRARQKQHRRIGRAVHDM